MVIAPGTTPASALDRDLLQLSQPLLNVQVGAGSDKFGGDGKMIDKDVAEFFLAKVGFQMNVTAQAFSDKDDPLRKELNYRPVIWSLIPLFTFLSPGFKQFLDGEEESSEGMDHDGLSVDSIQDDNTVGDFSMWSSEIAAQINGGQTGYQTTEEEIGGGGDGQSEDDEDVEEDEEEGDYESGAESDSEGDNASITSGLDLSGSFATHEDTRDLKRGEAVDFRLYGLDHRLGQSITLGVLDGKGTDSWPDYVYQILYYGCAGACRNIGVGRMKKVPCIAIGIGWWASAEIDPVGYVKVVASNNRVSKASVVAFKSHVVKKYQLLQSQGKFTEASHLQADYLDKSVEELVTAFTAQVRARTKEAAINLNERSFQMVKNIYTPTFKNPANLIVGTATYSARSCPMLRYPLVANARATQDDRTFISGMARMVYGDRVLNWRLNAVKKHSQYCHQVQRDFLKMDC